MSSLLSGLAQLQSVENRLRAAKAKLARCRRSVVLQENRIRTEENTLNAKKEELQLTRIQSDRLELDLKGRDQQIAKLRAALNTAKTNKEYASLLTILNTTKADNSKVEIQILELMKAIEADEAECQKSRDEIDAQKEKLNQVRKDAEASAEALQNEVESVQVEWDEAASMITPEALEIFKRVADTYDGQAVVDVEEQEGRSSVYSCTGCFMSITNESVNLLMTRDEIIRCANCTRILVLKKTKK